MSRILIVDDDPSIRNLLRLIFERAGHEVLEAAHGKAALDLILTAELPDLVTTDLMMPVMGGSEFIRQLRGASRTGSIPIVVVSGNADAAMGANASERADAVMSKPFVPEELLRLVQSLDGRAVSRETQR